MKRFALLAGAALATSFAWARPALMRIVVPFPPGGSNDVSARAMAPQLAKRLGTHVIVENKGGAAGVIGSDAVAKAPPDGSHLLLTSATYLTTAADAGQAALRSAGRLHPRGDGRPSPPPITPAPLVERLNKEINEISAPPELRVFLDPDGALPVAMAPAAIAARLKQDLAQLKRIAAERKISLD